MSALVFVLLVLMLLSLLAGLMRRQSQIAGLVVAFGLAWLSFGMGHALWAGTSEMFGHTFNANPPNHLLMFRFELDAAARVPVLLLLIWGALFAGVAAVVKTERILYPGIPLVVAALILFLSSTPLLWAPLWLVLAAVIMAFLAQGNTPRPARAALRILLMPILAFPFFLFAAWVFSQSAVAAEDPRLWNHAWKALIIGVFILTSPVPLHGWITALGETSSPFVGAFLVGVWQITIYAFIRSLLFRYPAMTGIADPGVWLPWIAVVQMLWAGAAMLGSQRLGQLWGYVLLWFYGAALLAWGLTGELGSQAMLWLLLAHPLTLTLAAAGLQSLEHGFKRTLTYDNLHGVSERMPFSALALLAGGFFVLGWPLGALFPMRMATYQVAAYRAGNIFMWGMLALMLAALGLIRAARHLTTPVKDVSLARESKRVAAILAILLAANVLLALNPGLLGPLVQQLMSWFNTL